MSERMLSKKDLWKYGIRYAICSQACMNYETSQSLGGVYAIEPYMEKLYGDEPEVLSEKLIQHSQYFNCQSYFAAAIWAAALAIEETKDETATATAVALKTSLMGPFAGVGDAIFNTIPKVVFASMAAYAAIEGNILTGLLLFLLVTPFIIFSRQAIINLAYFEGAKIVTEHQEQLNNIREAISVLGVIVVGALTASVVKVSTPIVFSVGESSQALQDVFNQIIPCLLPVLAVFGIYKGLDIKKMNTTRMVWLVIVIGLILSYFGIIG